MHVVVVFIGVLVWTWIWGNGDGARCPDDGRDQIHLGSTSSRCGQSVAYWLSDRGLVHGLGHRMRGFIIADRLLRLG